MSHVVVCADRTEFEEKWWDELNDFSAVIMAEGDSWFSFGSVKFRNCLLDLALPTRP